MAANYVCTKDCFAGSRFRPGDVVTEEVAAFVPSCFRKLVSKQSAKMQAEIEDILPEMADENPNHIKPISMTDLHDTLTPINGSEDAGGKDDGKGEE